MASQKLNQTGRKTSPIPIGDKVWFYKKSSSQEEAIKTGRGTKRLNHYRGPAKITKIKFMNLSLMEGHISVNKECLLDIATTRT